MLVTMCEIAHDELDRMYPSVFRKTTPHRRELVVLGHMVINESQTMCQNIMFY